MRGWFNRTLLGLIIVVTALSVVTVWPSEPDRYLPDSIPWPEGRGIKFPWLRTEGGAILGYMKEARAMRLGLDLRGGTRIVLEADTSKAPPDLDLDEAIEANRDIIERRINAFGVAESQVQRQGSRRLSVQLPGISEQEAEEKIGRTAMLRFCEPVTDEEGNIAVVTGGKALYESLTCDPRRGADGSILTEPEAEVSFVPYNRAVVDSGSIVWMSAASPRERGTELTGGYLKRNSIQITSDIVGRPLLILELNGEGGRLMEDISSRLVGLPLAFFLDDEPVRGVDDRIIAPVVQQQLGSDIQISGLNVEDANTLRTLLRTGAFQLPMKSVLIEEVDATLGDDSVRKSVMAGEVAILVVMLFMVLYYRLPGVLASLALFVYISILLAIFKVVPVTLTLAGIAAFILSVGMAVDANILIFERMKEELRLRRSLVASIDAGFSRAWPSIRDSNVSTLITCAILFWFGDQFGAALVKGFAITLGIGVLVSMFSAILVTRTFLRLTIGTPLARSLSWWIVDPDVTRVPHERLAAAGVSRQQAEE